MCKLDVRFSQLAEMRGVFSYAMKAEVVSASGMPSKVFVYHQMPAGVDGNTFAEFDHVATPLDFQEIPEDAASETVPWYRTDKCTIWTRSVSDLQLVKQTMVDDLSELQRTYSILTSEENYARQTTVEFAAGGPQGVSIADVRVREPATGKYYTLTVVKDSEGVPTLDVTPEPQGSQ